MASGPAARASLPSISTSRPIGVVAAQQANWLSRRTDRIQRATAWSGNVGSVSPALVDRFTQRVADRVQRSTRAHQINAFAEGDNLDAGMDMPLVTTDGQITNLSEGSSDETPFDFGAASTESVQRKPASPQPEAPAPPMPNALRERAEQLRRSMAEGTPAPASAVSQDRSAPAIQASRAPGATVPVAPRANVLRARPASRIEEMGPGKAPASRPAPAVPAAPVPEPPNPALQRKPQSPAVRPASPAVPVPTVQRAAIPPTVVQGQGRLTQMLNARFKPKRGNSADSDAEGGNSPAGEGSSTNDISSAPAPSISRSALPLQQPTAPDSGEPSVDLPARPPAMTTPADVPVPTPKARVLRKPAAPAATPATLQRKADASAPVNALPPGEAAPMQQMPAAASPESPVVQRKTDASAPANTLPSGEAAPMQQIPAAASLELPVVQRKADASASVQSAVESTPAAASPELPVVQRKADASAPMQSAFEATPALPPASPDAPAVQRAAGNISPLAAQIEDTAQEAPAEGSPDIQRTTRQDAAQDMQMPLVAPALKSEALSTPEGDAPAVQRDMADEAVPASPAPATIQRTPAPASSRSTSTPVSAISSASDDAGLPLRVPQAGPAVSGDTSDAPAESVQRAAAPAGPAPQSAQRESAQADRAQTEGAAADLTLRTPVAGSDVPVAEVQRSIAADVQASAPDAAPSSAPATMQPDAPAGDAPTAMPLRTPLAAPMSESALPVEAEPTPVIQRMAVNAPITPPANAEALSAVDADMPLVQRAPAEDMAEPQANGDESTVRPAGNISLPDPQAQPAAQAVNATHAAPAVQRKAHPAATPLSTDASAQGQMGVIQRDATPPADNEAPADLTLRAPAMREPDLPASSDAGEVSSPPSSAPATVQRSVNAGAPADVPGRLPPAATVQGSAAPAPNRTGNTPAIQRSAPSGSDAGMVLRTPAAPMADVQSDPAAVALQVVRRAVAAPAKANGARTKGDAMSLPRISSIGMTDMPVLRAVAKPDGEGMPPEARTLSMPIVQRAAVKQERQEKQEGLFRPVNPYVVAQERASSMPVVQRSLTDADAASTAPDMQRSLADADADAVKVSSKSLAHESEPSRIRPITDAELTKAAQRILPLIKRMLAVERERLFGR